MKEREGSETYVDSRPHAVICLLRAWIPASLIINISSLFMYSFLSFRWIWYCSLQYEERDSLPWTLPRKLLLNWNHINQVPFLPRCLYFTLLIMISILFVINNIPASFSLYCLYSFVHLSFISTGCTITLINIMYYYNKLFRNGGKWEYYLWYSGLPFLPIFLLH